MRPSDPPLPLGVEVLPQPTDTVCGPTCLQAVYRYFGREMPLLELIDQIPALPDGGTLAVHLGNHALKCGFRARLYTTDLRTFDPTWFRSGVDLAAKLQAQSRAKKREKLTAATQAYLDYLEAGGQVRMRLISSSLLRHYLDRGTPLLAGLSATYLYDSPRELANTTEDDIRGEPVGHFVVIRGYDADRKFVQVADPLEDNPGFESQYYSVHINRLLAAIHLGIVTYDANLLVLEPRDRRAEVALG